MPQAIGHTFFLFVPIHGDTDDNEAAIKLKHSLARRTLWLLFLMQVNSVFIFDSDVVDV